MVYDAGDFRQNARTHCLGAVTDLVPEGDSIDLMVLSHSDADHLGAVEEILDARRVVRVIRSGVQRETGTWRRADRAITAASSQGQALDINLRVVEFPPGGTYRFGDVFVTFIAGFHMPPPDWDIVGTSEENNAGSIVIRLRYAGKSVLFCGDAVGRHLNDPPDSLLATEKFMIDMSSAITIDSDVLIAPHHGADNASSTAFIEAVSPSYVVFSAGHAHGHPRSSAAARYVAGGVLLANIFRTDRGDDEGGQEWDHERQPNHRDPIGDDDVEIEIGPDGSVTVRYR